MLCLQHYFIAPDPNQEKTKHIKTIRSYFTAKHFQTVTFCDQARPSQYQVTVPLHDTKTTKPRQEPKTIFPTNQDKNQKANVSSFPKLLSPKLCHRFNSSRIISRGIFPTVPLTQAEHPPPTARARHQRHGSPSSGDAASSRRYILAVGRSAVPRRAPSLADLTRPS